MSHRMDQSMEHLREAVAEALPVAVEFPPGVLVTVLNARMTRNERYASVRLSVLPASAEADVLAILQERKGDIDYALSHKARLRRIPQFVWRFDDTESVAAGVDDIINELKAKGEL